MVRLIEGVRSIGGLLNRGFTVLSHITLGAKGCFFFSSKEASKRR